MAKQVINPVRVILNNTELRKVTKDLNIKMRFSTFQMTSKEFKENPLYLINLKPIVGIRGAQFRIMSYNRIKEINSNAYSKITIQVHTEDLPAGEIIQRKQEEVLNLSQKVKKNFLEFLSKEGQEYLAKEKEKMTIHENPSALEELANELKKLDDKINEFKSKLKNAESEKEKFKETIKKTLNL